MGPQRPKYSWVPISIPFEKGKVKKDAGKRSGLRRSAKRALVVKKKWLNLILAGQKTWEIRGSSSSKRGWIHFAESQAGGKLRGRARLVNCFPVPKESFQRHYKKHCVPSLTMVPYDAEEFEKPFQYELGRSWRSAASLPCVLVLRCVAVICHDDSCDDLS